MRNEEIFSPYGAPQNNHELLSWENLKLLDSRSAGIRRSKWHIVSALVQLVEEGADLEKLSIKEISKAAGISRQTFYNHFLDKYDAVKWLRSRIDEYTVNRIGTMHSWEWAIGSRLQIMKFAPKFFTEVFRAQELYEYVASEADVVCGNYEANILRLTGRTLDETESYLLKLYAEGSVRTALSWLNDDDGKSTSFIVRILGQSLPDFAKRVFVGQYYNRAPEAWLRD